MKTVLWGFRLLFLLLGVLTLSEDARADAIPGPPACPPGTQGESSHAGTWCAPHRCSDDGDCKAVGARCRPWRVCTRVAMVSSHRRGRGPERGVTVAVGSCAPAKGCSGTEEPPPPLVGRLIDGPPQCIVADYCLEPPLPPLPTSKVDSKKTKSGADDDDDSTARPTRSCGCQLADHDLPPGQPLLLVLAAVLGLIGRRRSS